MTRRATIAGTGSALQQQNRALRHIDIVEGECGTAGIGEAQGSRANHQSFTSSEKVLRNFATLGPATATQ